MRKHYNWLYLLGRDCDTTADIAGSITEAFYQVIPRKLYNWAIKYYLLNAGYFTRIQQLNHTHLVN